MAREVAGACGCKGQQAHTATDEAWIQPGYNRQYPAPGGKEEPEAETPEEYEKRIEGYAEAVEYFLIHADAPLNPVVRAFIESIRKEIESPAPQMHQNTLN